MHVDLVVVERGAQPELELAAALGLHAQVVVEDLDLGAAELLGPPHRDVRVAQQLLGVAVAAGRERDADARVRARAGGRSRGGSARQITRSSSAARCATGSMPLTSLHITMNSSPAMRPTRSIERVARLQPLGDLGQHLVAARVPERVVDELEPVEVDEQHRGVRLHAATARERVLQAVDEHHAVAQAGELVVRGAVAQLLLRVDHLGHVGERAHGARGRARGRGQRAAAQREPAFGVVGRRAR